MHRGSISWVRYHKCPLNGVVVVMGCPLKAWNADLATSLSISWNDAITFSKSRSFPAASVAVPQVTHQGRYTTRTN